MTNFTGFGTSYIIPPSMVYTLPCLCYLPVFGAACVKGLTFGCAAPKTVSLLLPRALHSVVFYGKGLVAQVVRAHA